MDPLQYLPDELIIVQALNLPVYSIDRLCQTSTRFNRLICNSELFWRQKYLQDYETVPRGYQGTWKDLYRQYSGVLPRRGREYGATRQGVSSGVSGFLTPTLYNEELVQFFAQAQLGPVVEEEFETETDSEGNMRRDLDTRTLHPTQIPPEHRPLLHPADHLWSEEPSLWSDLS